MFPEFPKIFKYFFGVLGYGIPIKHVCQEKSWINVVVESQQSDEYHKVVFILIGYQYENRTSTKGFNYTQCHKRLPKALPVGCVPFVIIEGLRREIILHFS